MCIFYSTGTSLFLARRNFELLSATIHCMKCRRSFQFQFTGTCFPANLCNPWSHQLHQNVVGASSHEGLNKPVLLFGHLLQKCRMCPTRLNMIIVQLWSILMNSRCCFLPSLLPKTHTGDCSGPHSFGCLLLLCLRSRNGWLL